MGEEVTIVEANRLRRGGVAGFFAKERFEVFVTERPEEAAAAAPRRTAPPPTGASGTATAPSPRVLVTAGLGRTATNGSASATTLVNDDRLVDDEVGAGLYDDDAVMNDERPS